MDKRAPRLDPILLLACACAAGACLALAPWATATAAVAIAARLWRLGQRRLMWACLAVLSLAGARAEARLQRGWDNYRATVALLPAPRRCEVVGRVARSPVVLRSGRDSDEPPLFGQARIDLAVGALRCDGPWQHPELVLRLYGAPDDMARDERLSAVIDVAPRRLYLNPDVPDARQLVALSGIAASGSIIDIEARTMGGGLRSWLDERRAAIRRRIDATFAPQLAPMARALVLGETDLSDTDREAYRLSGLAHLLAVSGTHLVIAVVALGDALSRLLAHIAPLARRLDTARISALLCIPSAWLYAEIAGGGGSAYRAAAMLSFAMAAKLLGGRPCSLRAFGWSLLGGVLIEPLALCDLSFALSVGATAGLLAANRPLRRLISMCGRVLGWLVGAFGTTVAAMLGCLPVLLAVGPEIPIAGIAANVLAAPVGELAALPLCLAHAVLWWWPAAEQGAAVLAMGALSLVNAIAHAATDAALLLRLPPPTPWQLAATAVCGVLLVTSDSRRRRCGWLVLATLALCVTELAAIRLGAPHGELRVTVLDIGQGDALLVDLPDGRLMLIDGGGLVGSPVDTAERAVLPLLRARRRSRVDIAVLSHPHPDHYGGWLTALKRIEVGEVWDSGLAQAEKPQGQLSRALLDLQRRGVPLASMSSLCAGPIAAAEGTIEVLSPCPSFDRARSANDNSLVIRVTLGERAALLTGDAEHAQEQLLLSQPERLRADFLKVGHHGSRTSTTPAFASAVAPSIAAISCGVRNRFGHPHAPTLATLNGLGANVLRTDRGGAISWSTDGRSQRWSQQQSWHSINFTLTGIYRYIP